MNKFIKIVVLMFSAFLIGCGARTSVQPGEVGKQLGTGGLESELFKPGVFRLDACFTSACPKLVRLQVNKSAVDLKIDSLFLPKSNVDLTNVTVGIQFRVKPSEKWVNKIYEEVKPVQATSTGDESNRVMIITTDMVWDTYGKRKAPDAIITALRDYKVDEVLVNVPEIAVYTKQKINEMLSDTPIEITELGFPNGIGEVPDEVRTSKRKLFAIEDDKAREMKALEAALEIEKHRQSVSRKRADNDNEIAGILNIPVSQYQCLRALDAFADAAGTGTSVVFASSCGLGSDGVAPVIIKK
jgi:hypothetical protein